MMVEKVPDSTYEMVGGLDKQIKEIKEVIELPVKHPELFEALGIAQPKVRYLEQSPRFKIFWNVKFKKKQLHVTKVHKLFSDRHMYKIMPQGIGLVYHTLALPTQDIQV